MSSSTSAFRADASAVPKLEVNSETNMGRYYLRMRGENTWTEEAMATATELGLDLTSNGIEGILNSLRAESARKASLNVFLERNARIVVPFPAPFFDKVFDDQAPMDFYGWFNGDAERETAGENPFMYNAEGIDGHIARATEHLHYNDHANCEMGLCEEMRWDRVVYTNNIARGMAIVDMLFLKKLKERQFLWARGVVEKYHKDGKVLQGWEIVREDLLFLVGGILAEIREITKGSTEGHGGEKAELITITTMRMVIWKKYLKQFDTDLPLFVWGRAQMTKDKRGLLDAKLAGVEREYGNDAYLTARGVASFEFFMRVLMEDLNRKARGYDTYQRQTEASRVRCGKVICGSCPRNWKENVVPKLLVQLLPIVMGLENGLQGDWIADMSAENIHLTYNAKRADKSYLTWDTLSEEQRDAMAVCVNGKKGSLFYGMKSIMGSCMEYNIRDYHLPLIDEMCPKAKRSYYEVSCGDYVVACFYETDYAEECYFDIRGEEDKWLRKVSKGGGVKEVLRTTNARVQDALKEAEEECLRRARERVAERERVAKADKLKQRIWDMNVWCKAVSIRDAKAKETARRAEHARQAEEAYRTRVEVKYRAEGEEWDTILSSFAEAYSMEGVMRIDEIKLIGGEPVEVLSCMWERDESGEDAPTYCGRCYVECYTTGRYMGVGAKYGVECEGVCCPACRLE